MPLLTDVKYETKISTFEKLTPDSVKKMLVDIRERIGELEPSFQTKSLAEVVKMVEKGKHTIPGKPDIRIDLSQAEGVISSYKRYSEGGCHSCEHMYREFADPMGIDRDSLWYCGVHESPDGISYGIGDSPMVKKHNNNPCNDWKPQRSPSLAELLKEEF